MRAPDAMFFTYADENRVFDALGTVDPLPYAAVAAGLMVVAVVASYLPAQRASAGVPVESLAAE